MGDRSRSSNKDLLMFRMMLVTILTVASTAYSQETDGEIVTVRLIDPRIVANTPDRMGIEWGKEQTDIIASRTLTKTQTQELKKRTDLGLSSDDDVPYCGHYPAYAIVYRQRSGNRVRTETICGLCQTWASDGKLRVLKGKEVLNYLEEILPLPAYFSDPATVKDRVLFAKNKMVPHYELEDK